MAAFERSVNGLSDRAEVLLQRLFDGIGSILVEYQLILGIVSLVAILVALLFLVILIVVLLRLKHRRYDEKFISNTVRITKSSAPELASVAQFIAIKYGDIGRAEQIRDMLKASDSYYERSLAAHALDALRAARSNDWESARKIIASTPDFEDEADKETTLRLPLDLIQSRDYAALEKWAGDLVVEGAKAFSSAIFLAGGVVLMCAAAIAGLLLLPV